jgi:hypothetical protein
VEIADKLREGSEGPFARAAAGLCRYALDDDSRGLETGLEELRVADAKHRLAYILTRAARLDLDQQRLESALARATEALRYAALLRRATEMMLAHTALAQANRGLENISAAETHEAAVTELLASGVAAWAATYAKTVIGAMGVVR